MKIWSSTEIWDMVEKMPVFELRKEFILKSDHDLAIRKLKRENEILRVQRNDKLVESLGEGYNQHAGDMIKELDAEIIKAIEEVL